MTANKVLEDVQRKIGRIAAGGGTFRDITKPTDYGAFVPAPADPRGREMGRTKTEEERAPFGRWLLLQAAGSSTKTAHQMHKYGAISTPSILNLPANGGT